MTCTHHCRSSSPYTQMYNCSDILLWNHDISHAYMVNHCIWRLSQKIILKTKWFLHAKTIIYFFSQTNFIICLKIGIMSGQKLNISPNYFHHSLFLHIPGYSDRGSQLLCPDRSRACMVYLYRKPLKINTCRRLISFIQWKLMTMLSDNTL